MLDDSEVTSGMFGKVQRVPLGLTTSRCCLYCERHIAQLLPRRQPYHRIFNTYRYLQLACEHAEQDGETLLNELSHFSHSLTRLRWQ